MPTVAGIEQPKNSRLRDVKSPLTTEKSFLWIMIIGLSFFVLRKLGKK
jgi:hypothetical protein